MGARALVIYLPVAHIHYRGGSVARDVARDAVLYVIIFAIYNIQNDVARCFIPKRDTFFTRQFQ